MISNKVIERLKRKNWYIKCRTKKDVDLVLQICFEAGIAWRKGEKATQWYPQISYPFSIGFKEDDSGISCDAGNCLFEANGLKNITDQFFNAIKNNDRKLTPQNAEQEHWVQIILARLQGIPIEAYLPRDKKWMDAGDDCSIFMDYEYRIKAKPTPIHVSRKIWKKINKEFPFLIMDKNKCFYHCKKAPRRFDGAWLLYEVDYVKSPLVFNSDGINWETSLTERPEGV